VKNPIKVLSGVILTVVVVGTLAVLAIKYFDVLLRAFDSVKNNVLGKRFSVFSDGFCDCGDDDDGADEDSIEI